MQIGLEVEQLQEEMEGSNGISRTASLDATELFELTKEFRVATVRTQGVLTRDELIKLVFNRLYLERDPADQGNQSPALSNASTISSSSAGLDGQTPSLCDSYAPLAASWMKSGTVKLLSLSSSSQLASQDVAQGGMTSGGAKCLMMHKPLPPLPSGEEGQWVREDPAGFSFHHADALGKSTVTKDYKLSRRQSWLGKIYKWEHMFSTMKGSPETSCGILGHLPKEYMDEAATAQLVANQGAKSCPIQIDRILP